MHCTFCEMFCDKVNCKEQFELQANFMYEIICSIITKILELRFVYNRMSLFPWVRSPVQAMPAFVLHGGKGADCYLIIVT